MIGQEEINIKFYVNRFDHTEIGGDIGWSLIVTNSDKVGGGGLVVQRWDHDPTQDEITNVTFAVKQGMSFITLYLACESPTRCVEVVMPRIRINVVDKKNTETLK